MTHLESRTDIVTELTAKGITPEQLDNEIHALKSMEASVINNNGLDDQVSYLLECGYTAQQIYESVEVK
jgi:alkylhydroperoxidase family enzyme